MKARVIVTLKAGVLDPQGKAIEGALKALGIEGVESVRQGKIFEVDLAGGGAARSVLEAAAERLLANPIIEDYDIQLSEEPAADGGEPPPVPNADVPEIAAQEAAAHIAMPPEGHP